MLATLTAPSDLHNDRREHATLRALTCHAPQRFLDPAGNALRATVHAMTIAAPKPWFLYLLECAGGRIYTGITVDVEARYAAHVAGKGARFTRAYPPSRILLSLTFADRSAASRAEYRVKQLSALQKRALIAGTFDCDFGNAGEVDAVADLKAPDGPAE